MATLVKEHEGIIYEEDFQENSLLWSLTPSDVDCLRFNPDGLRINHNKNYITYTFKEPDEPYCLIAEIDHTPLTEEDIGGVIVLSNTNEYAECQTYLATSPSTIENDGENLTENTVSDLNGRYVKYTIDDGTRTIDPEISSAINEVISTLNRNGNYNIEDENLQNMVDYIVNRLNNDNYAVETEEFYDELSNDILEIIDVLNNDGDGIWLDDDYETSESEEEETVINPSTGFIDTIYRYIKLIKYADDTGNIYQFFASSNGKSWIEVGTVSYPSICSIGFFLYSTKNINLLNKGKFLVKRLSLYENKYITINGINILQDFEIVTDSYSNTVLRSDTIFGMNIVNHNANSIIINTTELNLPIRNAILRTYPKGHYDETSAEYRLYNDTYGGDAFTINYDIKVFIDNEEIHPGDEYDLGLLYTNSFKRNIVIFNNEDFDLGNLTVKILAFSEFYSGEEEIQIAFYDKDKVEQNAFNYNYSNQLTIGRLESQSGVELIMKLKNRPKQEFYSAANNYKFKILIE